MTEANTVLSESMTTLSTAMFGLRDSPMPDDQRLQVLLNLTAQLAERVEKLEKELKENGHQRT